jgi:hypothetical protein
MTIELGHIWDIFKADVWMKEGATNQKLMIENYLEDLLLCKIQQGNC